MNKPNPITWRATGMALAAVALFPLSTLAAAPPEPRHGPDRDEMRQMRQQMMAEMQRQDAEMEKLVTEMNKATGDKKVDATAAALTRLVEQQREAHRRMASIQERMQSHMPEPKREPGSQQPPPPAPAAPGSLPPG